MQRHRTARGAVLCPPPPGFRNFNERAIETQTKRSRAKATNGFAKHPVAFKTANDLPKASRAEDDHLIMNERLADAIDLHMQMKQAHWNVKGPSFIGLHELFDRSTKPPGSTWIRSPSAPRSSAASLKERCASALSAPDFRNIRTASPRVRRTVSAVSAALAAFGQEVRQSIDQADELDYDTDTGRHLHRRITRH